MKYKENSLLRCTAYTTLTLALDFDDATRINNSRLKEPGEAEADQDVKHVAPYRVGHRHVAVTFSAIVEIIIWRCRMVSGVGHQNSCSAVY